MSPKLNPFYPKPAYASLKTTRIRRRVDILDTRGTSVNRCPLTWLVEHAAGVIAVLISVVGGIGLHKGFLDFVVVDSGANRELQILLSDRIPELVDHHDSQKVANGCEE